MKHTDCRQHWVRCLRDRGICTPAHVDTKENLADLFTNILEPAMFEGLRDQVSKSHFTKTNEGTTAYVLPNVADQDNEATKTCQAETNMNI